MKYSSWALHWGVAQPRQVRKKAAVGSKPGAIQLRSLIFSGSTEQVMEIGSH